MTQYRTPLKNVRGLGSSKSGTDHFVLQRLTATALIPLCIWFMIFVLSLLGSTYEEALLAVAKPWNAVLLVAFVVSMFWHLQLGLRVVLEDYVHNSLLALAVQTTVRFVSVLGALVCVFAVARIALVG